MRPMKSLGRHLGLRWYWADRKWFTHPGLYVWAFGRNLRIVPLRSAQKQESVQ